MNKHSIIKARDRLLENYSPNDYGTWTIYGEEISTGYHDEPKLDTVTGTYKNVIEYALTLNGFFHWGRGGRIEKKIREHNLYDVDSLYNSKVACLRAEKERLESRLLEIEQAISTYRHNQ